MNNFRTCFFAFLLSITFQAHAENIIRTAVPIHLAEPASQPDNTWIDAQALYGQWLNEGDPKDCAPATPELDSVIAGAPVTQTAICQQDQSRTVQARQKIIDQEVYRNVGEPWHEYQTINTTVTTNAIGTGIANSCLKAKQFYPAGASGVYTITINGREVSAYCDMTTDGGGWMLIGRGTTGIFNGWSSSRGEIAYPTTPSPSGSSTFKLSDDDINAIPKKSFKVVTTGYDNTRYFKGTCDYNHMQEPRGDCATSYSDENWNGMRGNGNTGSGGLAGAGGLIDKRGDNVSDGYFVLTSLVNRWDSWAAGNGTTAPYTGSGGAGTLISIWIWVR